MRDSLQFINTIALTACSPLGEIISRQVIHNAPGYRVRDQICRMLTTPTSSNPGTLGQVNYAYYRLDGTAVLGSAAQWVGADNSGTAISTRYYNSTYVSSVMFSATYTATAQVTCRAIALTDLVMSGASDVGSACKFYSTNPNTSIGSGGKLYINWTITVS